MPNQYEWGLWFPNNKTGLPHSYVFRSGMTLQAGTTYHFQTRNLRSWFNGPVPDPVMYLVRSNDIVAYNDDYTGLASEIIYTPTLTDTYTLIIRAYSTDTPGFCDLYQGIGGAPPSLINQEVMFGGTYVRARWKLGEWFETGPVLIVDLGGAVGAVGAGDDPYLFLVYPTNHVGSKMYMDDDGGPDLHAKIVPPAAGEGIVILGSYSRYSGGECRLGLVGQSYKAPWSSPAPWAYNADPVADTPSVKKYIEELKRLKPILEKLSPDKRDQGVLELQRKMLSEEEIRQQSSPAPTAATDLVHRQEDFLERYKQMEKDLVKMSYSERAVTLAQLKRETMGKEFSEPAEPLPPKAGTR